MSVSYICYIVENQLAIQVGVQLGPKLGMPVRRAEALSGEGEAEEKGIGVLVKG